MYKPASIHVHVKVASATVPLHVIFHNVNYMVLLFYGATVVQVRGSSNIGFAKGPYFLDVIYSHTVLYRIVASSEMY